jgi:pimeloyl-ACP methyl ester carboxylesterase
MIERFARWVDAIASASVVEARFVSSGPRERATALCERVSSMQGLTQQDWFPTPPELEPRSLIEGRDRGRPTQTLSWDLPEIGVSERLGVAACTGPPSVTIHGRERRRIWILLHGWLGGSSGRTRRDWPFEWLLERSDIAQVALPGHGPRREPIAARWPTFPTRNPLANATGLALATAELRQLVAWLRSCGYERIGVAGTSIGANIAALYATLDSDCDRLLLDRPLVRMSEPLRRVAARKGVWYRDRLTLLEAVYAPVNPLERRLRLASDRISVLIGRNDLIAGSQAGQALAAHFGVTPSWFAGSHVLPLGRRARVNELLSELPPTRLTDLPACTSDCR